MKYTVNEAKAKAATKEQQAVLHNVMAIETLQRMIQECVVPVKSMETMLRIMDFLNGQWMELTDILAKDGILAVEQPETGKTEAKEAVKA